MVKREDANKTSPRRVRDTDRQAVQPGCNAERTAEGDEMADRHEARYKPEMGTIVIKEYPPSHGES